MRCWLFETSLQGVKTFPATHSLFPTARDMTREEE